MDYYEKKLQRLLREGEEVDGICALCGNGAYPGSYMDTDRGIIVYHYICYYKNIPGKSSQWRYSMWVPIEWQHRVCTCKNAPRLLPPVEGTDGVVCSACHKYPRWLLIRCSNCGEHYLNLFRHPEWCPCVNRCLKCLEGFTSTCTCSLAHTVTEFEDYTFEVDSHPRNMEETMAQVDAELDDLFSSVVDLKDSVDFDF